eukprot:13180336-Alexandrium_andersonii.AAC.1
MLPKGRGISIFGGARRARTTCGNGPSLNMRSARRCPPAATAPTVAAPAAAPTPRLLSSATAPGRPAI